VIVATSSPGWAVLVDAFTYLVSVAHWRWFAWNWSVVKPSDTFFVLLREGWQQFWSRTWLWTVVVASSLFNMVIFAPYLVLGPVVAKEHLGAPLRGGSSGFARGRGTGRRDCHAACTPAQPLSSPC